MDMYKCFVTTEVAFCYTYKKLLVSQLLATYIALQHLLVCDLQYVARDSATEIGTHAYWLVIGSQQTHYFVFLHEQYIGYHSPKYVSFIVSLVGEIAYMASITHSTIVGISSFVKFPFLLCLAKLYYIISVTD